MGCQYLNSHNTTISYILNCNNNIQIGDASQVFYSTLYTSKSTQEEDSEKQLRIGRAVIKRIKRVLDEKNNYIGYFEMEEFIRIFNETPFLKEEGGIIVVKKKQDDFSMSQITQIVESNNAKLLGLFISKIENNEIAKIIKVDINKDLSIEPNDKNVTLEPFDQIYVRASIGFRNLKKVYVQGEANYTGQFIMDRTNMTVGDLLKRAGGVLSSANVNGALLIRRTIFYKNDANEDEQLNTLVELRSRYQDSTRSGYNSIDNIQLKKINQQIRELNLKKSKLHLV